MPPLCCRGGVGLSIFGRLFQIRVLILRSSQFGFGPVIALTVVSRGPIKLNSVSRRLQRRTNTTTMFLRILRVVFALLHQVVAFLRPLRRPRSIRLFIPRRQPRSFRSTYTGSAASGNLAAVALSDACRKYGDQFHAGGDVKMALM